MRALGKVLGHGPDTRTDFKHAVRSADPGGFNDLFQYITVNQKILSVALLKIEMIFFEDFYGAFRISKCGHGLSPFLLLLRNFEYSVCVLLCDFDYLPGLHSFDFCNFLRNIRKV